MSRQSISFTEPNNEWLNSLVESKEYSSKSEIINDLIRKARESAKEVDAGMRPNSPTETDIPCKLCDRPMMVRTAGTGVFLGCSGYALPPKERCKHTVNLISGDEVVSANRRISENEAAWEDLHDGRAGFS